MVLLRNTGLLPVEPHAREKVTDTRRLGFLISYGFNRPLFQNLILEEVERNAGAASSSLAFSYLIVGAFSMWLIALDRNDKIGTTGIPGAVSGGLVLKVAFHAEGL